MYSIPPEPDRMGNEDRHGLEGTDGVNRGPDRHCLVDMPVLEIPKRVLRLIRPIGGYPLSPCTKRVSGFRPLGAINLNNVASNKYSSRLQYSTVQNMSF